MPTILRKKQAQKRSNYTKSDLVFIITKPYEWAKKPNTSKFVEGPYKVISIQNGTLEVSRGEFDGTIHFIRLRPHYKVYLIVMLFQWTSIEVCLRSYLSVAHKSWGRLTYLN